jgi:hypothetical protein
MVCEPKGIAVVYAAVKFAPSQSMANGAPRKPVKFPAQMRNFL